MSLIQIIGVIGVVGVVGGMLLLAAWLIVSSLWEDHQRGHHDGCGVLALIFGLPAIIILFMSMASGRFG
jgi:hypothetical protein